MRLPILPFLLLWTVFTVPVDADTSSSSDRADGVSDNNNNIINTAARTSAQQQQQQQQSHDTCFGEAQPIRDRGYHHNCDLNSFTDYKATIKKNLIQRRLTKTGINNVPDEKTVICPDSVNTTVLVEDNMIIGQDTMWFVENTALTPVVVSWVDWKKSNSREYSAVHRKVYPAQSDPDTILYPGQWKAIHAFEGDIFYVREMIASGGGSGPLMLQHRVGLTPIYDAQTRKRMLLLEAAKNRALLGSSNIVVDDDDINKIDELIKAYGNDQRNPPIIENQDSERAIDINYDWKTCNVVDIGFRNYAKRPLNVYWLERHNNNNDDHQDNNNNDDDSAYYCTEQYKFHIGLNKRPTNFAFDFKSNTKYEKSYIGHTFVFRSSLSGKWVATHTIKPTQVNDCPTNKKRTSSNEVVILPNYIQESIMIRKEGHQQENITNDDYVDVDGEFNEYATKEELDYLQSTNNNNNNNVSTTIMTIIPMTVSAEE